MVQRGTARSPGADPTRLAIGLDLRAISIVEGVRAGLAAALPIALAEWSGNPALPLAALGALFTCIVDPGGAVRHRAALLLGFAVTGAALYAGFGLVRGLGPEATLLAAAPVLFLTACLRVWGQATLGLSNLLAVLVLLGADQPLTPAEALLRAGCLAAGGLWAVLLSVVIWRIHPYGPARRAVADVWAELEFYARALRRLIALAAAPEAWDAASRAHRGAVRTAIERARDVLMATIRDRGPASGPAAQNLLRLEAADQLFALLIALDERLEPGGGAVAGEGSALLRRLRPILAELGRAFAGERADRSPRIERAAASLAEVAGDGPLAPLAAAMSERLLAATRMLTQNDAAPPPELGEREAGPGRMLAKARADLRPGSALFRHALRTVAVVTPALAYALYRHGPYTHWLTITLVLLLQPYFAATWQRTLERIGGTLAGGAIAAALTFGLQSRLHLAGLLPVLGALALAVRQVSYAVYIAAYTPVVILLVEAVQPGGRQLDIALARTGYTLLAGFIAIAANRWLWPSWEPERLREALRRALAAHASYAERVADGADASHAARREAGLASNALEATLGRAIAERRDSSDRLRLVLTADALLRRIAGQVTALTLHGKPAPDARQTLAACAAVLTALARGESPTLPPQTDPANRLLRQTDLLRTLLLRPDLQPLR